VLHTFGEAEANGVRKSCRSAPDTLGTSRAHDVMERYGVDGLIALDPMNVYYVTNTIPPLFLPRSTTHEPRGEISTGPGFETWASGVCPRAHHPDPIPSRAVGSEFAST